MTGTILITGATGYIGSHTWCVLAGAGYNVIGLDNFSNSFPGILSRISKLTKNSVNFIECDLQDELLLKDVFSRYRVDAVIHFAALKSVKESVEDPLTYYKTNLIGLFTLVKVMASFGVKKLVYSSSATVYGEPASVPIQESFPLKATSAYGQTKLTGELFLRDLEKSDDTWRIGSLRYFNPAGAHESGLIGENPRGLPNNLMPFLAKVAFKSLPKLLVYGGDYPTTDGTGVRDYIHVMDVAEGHLCSVEKLLNHGSSFTLNLGTGRGVSVLELINSYELESGREIPYEIVGRRPGDIASCYADPRLACEILGWIAKRGVNEMCRDSWNWQSKNPDGVF